MTKKIEKFVLIFVRSALVLVALGLGVLCLIDPGYNKYGGVLASLALPFLPIFAGKLFRVKISFRLQLIYYGFLFVALFMGIDMDLYRTWPHFDKIIHLLSGALSVVLGHYALVFFKVDKSSKLFKVVFMVCFAVTIGVAWEFFEFACDKLLGQSMQQLVSEGVDDTMFDLLSATVGAIFGSIWIVNQKSLKFLEK
ncbi:MAG: hypothetical protein LBT19_00555 [Candidatus Nomurabacteria bacterium]|jgi:hypothetical protein|nr:hypothetical protein [Candidatus Nomurabacteria bacterium]